MEAMTDNEETLSVEEPGSTSTPDSEGAVISSEKRRALESRAQRAFESIAEDAALTDALTDDAAKILLDWTLEETQRLAATTQEMENDAAQAALAPKLHHLRRFRRHPEKRPQVHHGLSRLLSSIPNHAQSSTLT